MSHHSVWSSASIPHNISLYVNNSVPHAAHCVCCIAQAEPYVEFALVKQKRLLDTVEAVVFLSFESNYRRRKNNKNLVRCVYLSTFINTFKVHSSSSSSSSAFHCVYSQKSGKCESTESIRTKRIHRCIIERTLIFIELKLCLSLLILSIVRRA